MKSSDSVRVVPPEEAPPRRHHPPTCTVPGCGQTTTGGKPFCSEHLDQMPYIQGLIDRLASRPARAS
ncbi:MAG: hypothetical protein AB7N76_16720 [Planctomycetota bacterium]